MFNNLLNSELSVISQQSIRIAVLVSSGRHPVSGRPRRAINDAQALEMALEMRLKLATQYPVALHVLHAGLDAEPVLRSYLGMGIDEIEILALPPDTDILPPLAARLCDLQPQLILTGVRAESGWGSGCLPYFLAQRLGFPIVSNADYIALSDTAEIAEVHKVMAHGYRRALDVHLPAVISVDAAAPPPRQSAFARARRGHLKINAIAIDTIAPPFFGEVQPARKRPKRLRVDTATSAAERLKAITEVAAGHSRSVEPGSAEEAAHIIYEYLAETGLVKSHSQPD